MTRLNRLRTHSSANNPAQIVLLVVLSAVLNSESYAQTSNLWQVKKSRMMAVTDFKLNSPIIADMRTYEASDDVVFITTGSNEFMNDGEEIQLMPIYSLLACMHLTNPNSTMTVESGGGYDIKVRNAQFANGTWDADVRISEITEVDMLDSTTKLMFDKLTVGTLQMENPDQRIAALNLMVAACL